MVGEDDYLNMPNYCQLCLKTLTVELEVVAALASIQSIQGKIVMIHIYLSHVDHMQVKQSFRIRYTLNSVLTCTQEHVVPP